MGNETSSNSEGYSERISLVTPTLRLFPLPYGRACLRILGGGFHIFPY